MIFWTQKEEEGEDGVQPFSGGRGTDPTEGGEDESEEGLLCCLAAWEMGGVFVEGAVLEEVSSGNGRAADIGRD